MGLNHAHVAKCAKALFGHVPGTTPMRIPLDDSSRDTLTNQIVRGIRRLVDSRELRPEARLPSIRRFAATHDVSTFTVVQAYDRLVASGHIQSRRGAGFFVSRRTQPPETRDGGVRLDHATDVLWLIRQQARRFRFKHLPGCSWLPRSWLEGSGLGRAMRCVSHEGGRGILGGYGDPRGFAPLRENVRRRLADFGIEARADQVLLVNGTSGGIDLVCRCLIQPGDLVFVDDPGYFRTFGHMRVLGATIHGVPWTVTGPDLEQLGLMAETHRPRLFVTASIVQDPTGSSISRGTAFRLLQLAERFDFHIVEADVNGTCHPTPPPRLASLDQLNRVIYVNGFSKALSPRLRVGFVAGHGDLVQDLVDLKLLTQAASSEFAERLVYEVLAHGEYRKHRSKLLANLERARERALRGLEALGLGPARDDAHGLFAWMDVPGVADTTPLAEAAVGRDMLLAPGAMFSPDMAPSPKMRFNVAFCQSDEMLRELEALLNEHA